MKYIIYGAGKTGYRLAEVLYAEGGNIVVIDPMPEKLFTFSERLDVLCVEGHIGNVETISKINFSNKDIFIAVSDSDEENIIACMIAKKMNVFKTLARLRNPTYFDSNYFDPGLLGIDHVVNPEKEVALEISKLISIPLATEVDSVVREKLSLLEIRVADFELDYLKKKLNILLKEQHIIVINPEKRTLFFYEQESEITNEDYIYLIHTTKDIQNVNQLFYDKYPKIKNVMIVGGGQIASELLFFLEKKNIYAKLFEVSKKRCSYLNHIHKKSLILCGDATDIDLLLQEELDQVDCFIALMGDDENNVVVSLFAKHKGVKKVITKVSKNYGSDLLETIAITVPVDIHNITVNKIRSYVTMKQLVTLTNLFGNFEMLEFIVTDQSKLLNKNIKQKKLFEGVYIAALYRNFELIHDFENQEIRLHDRIIIFAQKNKLRKVEKYFK
jgi:trk system potassium uptake protein